MRKPYMVLSIIGLILMMSLASADKPNLALKGNFLYNWSSFEGFRTSSIGWGGTLEKHQGYGQRSFLFIVDYIYRLDENSQPLTAFDDVWYFGIGSRQYAPFNDPMNGPYVGLTSGIGIPRDEGVFWDLNFLAGYQVIRGKVAVDLNVQLGMNILSYRQSTQIGSIHYYFWGFGFRPGISVGFAI